MGTIFTKEKLEELGIYENCKFCGGSLEYKQCGHTYRYKSICKGCKEDRSLHFKKEYYKKMGWVYKTDGEKRIEMQEKMDEYNKSRKIEGL